jgi:hypothetical protein
MVKPALRLIALSVALFTLNPTSALGQEAVFEGTTGNSLVLQVTNSSATFTLPGVTVEVMSGPTWITFTTTSDALGDIAPSAAETADLSFDVTGGTAGDTGTIELRITASSGDVITPAEDPNLSIPVSIFNGGAVAFVLDRSGSMGGGPLAGMKGAASQGIWGLSEGDEVAVIGFASSANVAYPLTRIDGSAERSAAARAVESLAAGGETSIGAGLSAAHGALQNAESSERNYVLLSDGDENVAPFVSDVMGLFGGSGRAAGSEFAVAEPVTLRAFSGGGSREAGAPQGRSGDVVHHIHAIAYGEVAAANLLVQAAAQTGGIFAYAPDREDPLALARVFEAIQGEISGDQSQGAVEGTLAPSAEDTHPFEITGDIRVQTVKLLWSDPDADLTLELNTPDGTLITPAGAGSHAGIEVVSGPGIQYFTLADPLDGTWIARTRAESATSDVNYALTFSARSDVQMTLPNAPLTPDTGGPIALQVRLSDGGAPITGSTVTAEVAPPGYELSLRAAHAERILATLRDERAGSLREEDFEAAWEEAGRIVNEQRDLGLGDPEPYDREIAAREALAQLGAARGTRRSPQSKTTPLLDEARSENGPYTVTLYDDGAHDDGAAGDGLYGAVLIDAPFSGTYTYAVHASGPLPGGGTFTREARRSLYVSIADDVVGNVDVLYTALSFAAAPSGPEQSAITFELSNAGLQPLEWTASTDAAWLSTGRTSGTVNYGSLGDEVRVLVDPDLAPATYTGIVTLTTNDPDLGTFTLPVTLVIADAPAGFPDYILLDLGLPSFSNSELVVVDYDGDGDLDPIVFGQDQSTSNIVARAYRNDAGSYTATDLGVPGVEYGTSAWADYDGDGDLDFALVGRDGNSPPIATLFRNDGGTYVDAGASLPGLYDAALAWADYDGDGDLDLAYTGSDSDLLLYENDGGAFTEVGTGLSGTRNGRIAWGDYDDDGDPDLVLTGFGGDDTARLYRNDGGTFTAEAVGLNPSADGPATWIDFDGDGDLDLALSGTFYEPSHLYRNDGGTLVHAQILPTVSGGGWAWGDLDQDGDADLAVGTFGYTSFLANVNSALVDAEAQLGGPWFGDFASGDLDGDGFLDLVYTGSSGSGVLTRQSSLACESTASGDWSSPATWTGCDGGIPSDAVAIRNGHTVTVGAVAEVGAVTVTQGGTLALSDSLYAADVAVEPGADITFAAGGVLDVETTLTTAVSLIVTADASLDVAPGGIVQAGEGVLLTLQGKTDIRGTAAAPVVFEGNGLAAGERWGGLRLEGDDGFLGYVEVHDADVGVAVRARDVTLYRLTLSGNGDGVVSDYASGSTLSASAKSGGSSSKAAALGGERSRFSVRFSTIEDNAGHGLVLRNADVDVLRNTIADNAGHGVLVWNADAFPFQGNTVTGNGGPSDSTIEDGVAVLSGGDATLYSFGIVYSEGGNTVADNAGHELSVAPGGFLSVGSGAGGHNAVTESTSGSGYNLVYNGTKGMTVSAEETWWGFSSGPPNGALYGAVDFKPYMTSPPSGSSSLALGGLTADEGLIPAEAANGQTAYAPPANDTAPGTGASESGVSGSDVRAWLRDRLRTLRRDVGQGAGTNGAPGLLRRLYALQRLDRHDVLGERDATMALLAQLRGYLDGPNLPPPFRRLAEASLAAEVAEALRTESYEEAEALLAAYALDVEGDARLALVLDAVAVDEQAGRYAEALARLDEVILSLPPEEEGLARSLSVVASLIEGRLESGERLPIEDRVAVKDASEGGPPRSFALGSAYPNPTRTSATVPFEVPETSDVQIGVYDLLGRRVAVLTEERFEPGRHSVTLEASRLATGVYLLRATMTGESGAGHVFTQKLTLLQ